MLTQIELSEVGLLEYQNRILTVRVNEGVEITEQLLEKIFRQAEQLAGGEKYVFLADMRKQVSSSVAGRKYGAKNPYQQQHLAYALLAENLAEVMLSNFFIRVNRPAVPSRWFRDEQSAWNWLNKFL